MVSFGWPGALFFPSWNLAAQKNEAPGLRIVLQRAAALLRNPGDGPVFGYPVPHLQTTGNISRSWNFYHLHSGGFLWDWLVTIGWLPTKPGEQYLRFENLIVKYIPLFLRLLLILWGFAFLLADLLAQGRSPFLWLDAGVVLCLILGIAGRVMAIAALVILGFYQTAAPLDTFQLGLIVVYTNLLFLGTGNFSLWSGEDRLIFHSVGDRR